MAPGLQHLIEHCGAIRCESDWRPVMRAIVEALADDLVDVASGVLPKNVHDAQLSGAGLRVMLVSPDGRHRFELRGQPDGSAILRALPVSARSSAVDQD